MVLILTAAVSVNVLLVYVILYTRILNWFAVLVLRSARVFDQFGACLIRHIVLLFFSLVGALPSSV